MKNNQSDTSLPQMMTDNFQKMASISLEAMQPMLENMVEAMASFNRNISESGLPALNIVGTKGKSKCCPPEESCPPHCIASITRQAMEGERIIVPILVTNNCSGQRTFRVGVRELLDRDGNPAPSDPALNKNSITLDPGRSERILMTIDLVHFTSGSTYETEIVLREREINQNICFTLNVMDHPATEAIPYDENQFKRRWQSWQSHFYCEPQPNRNNGPVKALKPS